MNEQTLKVTPSTSTGRKSVVVAAMTADMTDAAATAAAAAADAGSSFLPPVAVDIPSRSGRGGNFATWWRDLREET